MGATINLAGKQRMLTQKMTKELLLVANGIDADANKANLGKTVALFQSTLTGLLDGDEGLGLPGIRRSVTSCPLSRAFGNSTSPYSMPSTPPMPVSPRPPNSICRCSRR
jgi:hypothetical protein